MICKCGGTYPGSAQLGDVQGSCGLPGARLLLSRGFGFWVSFFGFPADLGIRVHLYRSGETSSLAGSPAELLVKVHGVAGHQRGVFDSDIFERLWYT